MCGNNKENQTHPFVNCRYVKKLWDYFLFNVNIRREGVDDLIFRLRGDDVAAYIGICQRIVCFGMCGSSLTATYLIWKIVIWWILSKTVWGWGLGEAGVVGTRLEKIIFQWDLVISGRNCKFLDHAIIVYLKKERCYVIYEDIQFIFIAWLSYNVRAHKYYILNAQQLISLYIYQENLLYREISIMNGIDIFILLAGFL